jgi:hypothetical protein
MEKIKLGLIGLGYIGKIHLKHRSKRNNNCRSKTLGKTYDGLPPCDSPQNSSN